MVIEHFRFRSDGGGRSPVRLGWFPNVACNATRDLYRAVFGNRLKRMVVVPIAALHVDRTGPIRMSE